MVAYGRAARHVPSAAKAVREISAPRQKPKSTVAFVLDGTSSRGQAPAFFEGARPPLGCQDGVPWSNAQHLGSTARPTVFTSSIAMESDALSHGEPAAPCPSEAANSEESPLASGLGCASGDKALPGAAATSSDGAGESASSVILQNIARLKEEQADIPAQRVQVAKELRNAEKKRSRLKKKAKLLSDKDLLDVLHLRTVEKADKQTAAAAEDKDTSADAAPAARVKQQKV